MQALRTLVLHRLADRHEVGGALDEGLGLTADRDSPAPATRGRAPRNPGPPARASATALHPPLPKPSPSSRNGPREDEPRHAPEALTVLHEGYLLGFDALGGRLLADRRGSPTIDSILHPGPAQISHAGRSAVLRSSSRGCRCGRRPGGERHEPVDIWLLGGTPIIIPVQAVIFQLSAARQVWGSPADSKPRRRSRTRSRARCRTARSSRKVR